MTHNSSGPNVTEKNNKKTNQKKNESIKALGFVIPMSVRHMSFVLNWWMQNMGMLPKQDFIIPKNARTPSVNGHSNVG